MKKGCKIMFYSLFWMDFIDLKLLRVWFSCLDVVCLRGSQGEPTTNVIGLKLLQV